MSRVVWALMTWWTAVQGTILSRLQLVRMSDQPDLTRIALVFLGSCRSLSGVEGKWSLSILLYCDRWRISLPSTDAGCTALPLLIFNRRMFCESSVAIWWFGWENVFWPTISWTLRVSPHWSSFGCRMWPQGS